MGTKEAGSENKINVLSQQDFFLFACAVLVIMSIGLFLYCILNNVSVLLVDPYWASPLHWLGLFVIFWVVFVVKKLRGDFVG